MRGIFVLAAFAVAALSSAQIIGSGGSPYSFSLTTTNDLEYGVLLTVEETSPFVYETTQVIIGQPWRNIAAGTYNFTVNMSPPTPNRTGQYVFAALYSGGVSLTLSPAFANFVTAPGTGRDWNTLFSLDPENTIALNLRDMYSPTEAPAAFDVLTQFGRRNGTRWQVFDAPSTLVSFSEPTITGSASLVLVPEPGTLLALGTGAALLLRRRNRNR